MIVCPSLSLEGDTTNTENTPNKVGSVRNLVFKMERDGRDEVKISKRKRSILFFKGLK